MQFFTQIMAVSRQKLPLHPPPQNPSLSFDLPAAGRKAAQRRLSFFNRVQGLSSKKTEKPVSMFG